MYVFINGVEHAATEDETVLQLEAGKVLLSTDAQVLFWDANDDPTVRQGDIRRDNVKRLFGVTPVEFVAGPRTRIAFSLAENLPPVVTVKPDKVLPAADVESDEERAERRAAEEYSKLVREAELVNAVRESFST